MNDPQRQSIDRQSRIVLPGGAGLVGQNLVVRLKARGYSNILVLDKHAANLATLADLHPDIDTALADLAQPGPWQASLRDADIVVILQAQIGGHHRQEFERNNIAATQLILDTLDRQHPPYLVHVSSSVVKSVAADHYTDTKRAQEELIQASGFDCPVLRPTLMFGWFDRKHLGWLSRFMARSPVFPVPGRGRFTRQPLYVGDFCDIIISCIEQHRVGGVYNISGLETVDYIDMIRALRRATGARTLIVHIPYGLFHLLLRIWGWFDRDPPFTTQQLEALVADDRFEVIDWPGIFGVSATPFDDAVRETFTHDTYSKIALRF